MRSEDCLFDFWYFWKNSLLWRSGSGLLRGQKRVRRFLLRRFEGISRNVFGPHAVLRNWETDTSLWKRWKGILSGAIYHSNRAWIKVSRDCGQVGATESGAQCSTKRCTVILATFCADLAACPMVFVNRINRFQQCWTWRVERTFFHHAPATPEHDCTLKWAIFEGVKRFSRKYHWQHRVAINKF